MINKSAFTLSEVLITLVIIGIIAALTVTSVIQNTQKNEIKVKVKKTYSTIQQAVSMEYAQTGRLIGNQGLDSFDNIKNNFLKKRLKLNVLQVPVWEGSEKYYLPDGTLIQIITFGTENNYALLDFRLNKGPDKTIEDINELGNNFQLTIIGNKVYPGHAYVSNGKVSGEDGELIEKGEVYYPQEREDWVQQAETLQKILTEK